MATIRKGKSTYEGFKEVDGKLVCEKCGGTTGRLISHIDGTDFYGSSYECECGNVLSVTSKRSKEDMMYWM